MSEKPPLGRLVKVDLRTHWEREDTGFTPWLAAEENIQLLSETIGLELEVVSQEVRVGPFRADILCRTPGDGHHVLIENQLEVTDHRHLGQLMTYAAGLDAVSIVWIAERFAEEHRAALDWLNRITAEGVNFFGLEIELWKIGESLAAPKFNLVSQPNEWVKQGAEAARQGGDLTVSQQLNLAFWTAFCQALPKLGTQFRPVKPRPDNWLTFAIGTSLFTLESVLGSREGCIGVRLSFPIAYWDVISADRAELDATLGEATSWSQARTVGVVHLKNKVDLEDRERWPEYQQWLYTTMARFAAAFKGRVDGYKQRLQYGD